MENLFEKQLRRVDEDEARECYRDGREVLVCEADEESGRIIEGRVPFDDAVAELGFDDPEFFVKCRKMNELKWDELPSTLCSILESNCITEGFTICINGYDEDLLYDEYEEVVVDSDEEVWDESDCEVWWNGVQLQHNEYFH